jgi:hypothetical protein
VSAKALVAACEQGYLSFEQRKAFEKQVSDLKAKEASEKKFLEEISKDIAEAEEEEKEIKKEFEGLDRKSMIVDVIHAVVHPLTVVAEIFLGTKAKIVQKLGELATTKQKLEGEVTALETQLKAKNLELEQAKTEELKTPIKQSIIQLEGDLKIKKQNLTDCNSAATIYKNRIEQQIVANKEREKRIHDKKDALRQSQKERNASLAESVTRLQGLGTNIEDVKIAITSLELMQKTLGRVKTIFSKTQLFWERVETYCDQLAKVDMIVDAAQFQSNQLIETLFQSGFQWLTLGNTVLKAQETISGINRNVDNIMNDLPTSAEAPALIAKLTKEIDEELKKENFRLDQQ